MTLSTFARRSQLSFVIARVQLCAKAFFPKAWNFCRHLKSVVVFLIEDEILRRREAREAKLKLKAAQQQIA